MGQDLHRGMCDTENVMPDNTSCGSQGANAQLRGRVQDLAADLQGAEEEVAVLEGLQEQLAAEVGADEHIRALVDAAVAREHAVQEARNRKVLDLLSTKVR